MLMNDELQLNRIIFLNFFFIFLKSRTLLYQKDQTVKGLFAVFRNGNCPSNVIFNKIAKI